MLQVVTHPDQSPRGLLTATVREDLVETSQADRRIVRAVEDATAAAEAVSTGNWIYREYIERIRLRRSREILYLEARPVQSVVSVTFDGDPFLESDGDFEIVPSGLYREDGWHGFGHSFHHSHTNGSHHDSSVLGHGSSFEVIYFGGYWLKASMGLARGSFAGTDENPGSPLVDVAVLEGGTTMGIKGGTGEETIAPADTFKVAGVTGSFRFRTAAVASGGVIVLQPDGFFEPAAPQGGFADGAAIEISHGVQEIDVHGIHLRNALQEVVQASWFKERRNPGRCKPQDPDRSQGPVGIDIPPSAYSVFSGEGSLVGF